MVKSVFKSIETDPPYTIPGVWNLAVSATHTYRKFSCNGFAYASRLAIRGLPARDHDQVPPPCKDELTEPHLTCTY